MYFSPRTFSIWQYNHFDDFQAIKKCWRDWLPVLAQGRRAGVSELNVGRLTSEGKVSHRECLSCGMRHQQRAPDIADRQRDPLCIKCDSPIFGLSDGSTVTVDIAHQRETVLQAIEKFEQNLNGVWKQTHAQNLRLIVGGGLIRDAVLAELFFKKSRGTVLDFSEENRGAVLIRIR
jgi:hypothetical protein